MGHDSGLSGLIFGGVSFKQVTETGDSTRHLVVDHPLLLAGEAPGMVVLLKSPGQTTEAVSFVVRWSFAAKTEDSSKNKMSKTACFCIALENVYVQPSKKIEYINSPRGEKTWRPELWRRNSALFKKPMMSEISRGSQKGFRTYVFKGIAWFHSRLVSLIGQGLVASSKKNC